MIRKPNKFSRPRKPYEAVRIKEENVLLEKYALKNKKEVWKTIAKVNYFRRRAMSLAKAPIAEQEVFFGKLRELGLPANSIADVLALNVENILQRRLPTVLHRKGLASTVREARQMIVHKRVFIESKINNTPSYLVPVSEEDKLSVKKGKAKPAKKEESQPAEPVSAEESK